MMPTPAWLRTLPPVGMSTVVALGGEIDTHAVDELRGSLLALPAADVVVDLSQVRFCGTAGIRLLLRLEDRLAAEDHTLCLVAVPRPVRRLITLLELQDTFVCQPTIAEATRVPRRDQPRDPPARHLPHQHATRHSSP